MANILVIGGGIIGLCSARALQAAGYQVSVFDRAATVGSEASRAGGGILSALYPWRSPQVLSDLVSRSRQLYPDFCEELAQESQIDPQFFNTGMLVTGLDDAEYNLALAYEADQVLPVSNVQVAQREPGLVLGEASKSVLLPRVANARNPFLMPALERSCARRGIQIYTNATVERVLQADGCWHLMLEDGRKFAGDGVVLAAGAWSSPLLAQFGLDARIEPVKGQMIAIRSVPGVVRHIILHGGRYLIPRREGTVVVGSTMENTGFDKSLDSDAAEGLYRFAVDLFPALRQYPVVKHWSGLRPSPGSDAPLITAVDNHPGVVVATGHYRAGIASALATAEQVVDLIRQALSVQTEAETKVIV